MMVIIRQMMEIDTTLGHEDGEVDDFSLLKLNLHTDTHQYLYFTTWGIQPLS